MDSFFVGPTRTLIINSAALAALAAASGLRVLVTFLADGAVSPAARTTAAQAAA